MSHELAVPDDGPLSGPDVAGTVAKLRAARQYARSCAEDEALKAKRDAEVVRHWVKVNKAAAVIGVEACKLQATAVRRLAQLGSHHIAGAGRSAAEWLGSMTDQEFSRLLDGMRYAKNPSTLYSDHLKQEERDGAFNRGQAIAEGEGDGADYDSVCNAASNVLHAAMAGGRTTVAEMSDQLAEVLGYGGDGRHYAIREGIESVIREALRTERISGEAHPDFVTWKDREAGWLRIPWPAATLDQLRWMAEFREEQARELAEAAETLRILVRDLDAIRAGNRHLTRLNDLWAALQAALEAEEDAA
jgi:hypothetical protein